jgi:phosphoribosylglycinamide formyltransferase-1
MKRVVILISGRGSNMAEIVRVCRQDAWPARIEAVISNRPDAAGLALAQAEGIATAVVDHTRYAGDRAAFDAELARIIDGYAPDLVVLAGFMRVLTDGFVGRYAGRMLNIHPSLLPSFPGLKTHQQAIDAGVKLHGSTVHFVTPTLDHGPIVIQAAVPVNAGDDPATLAARVLRVEHVIYPRAIRWFIDGRLSLVDGRAILAPSATQWLFSGEGA